MVFLSTREECNFSLWSSSKAELLHPEWGMITVLVRVDKASLMIVILTASHEERFHSTPERANRKKWVEDSKPIVMPTAMNHKILLCAQGVCMCGTRRRNNSSSGFETTTLAFNRASDVCFKFHSYISSSHRLIVYMKRRRWRLRSIWLSHLKLKQKR